MVPRLVAALTLTFLLSACALERAEQKVEYTSFEPTADGFRYKGHAYGLEPLESSTGEAWRIGILEEYLKDNGVCPNGCDIVSLRPILINKSVLGDNYAVYDEGHCK